MAESKWVATLLPRSYSFLYGMTLPWRAFRLILSKPLLIFWSILPITLTLAFYFFVIRWMSDSARETMLQYLASHGWQTEGWGLWFLMLLVKLILFLVAALTFSLSSSILASPFNDWLAECAEPHAEPPLTPPSDVPWSTKLRLVGIDIFKSLLATVMGISALLLSWLPIVNVISFVAAFLLLTFQYISYPQTRRGEGVRDGLGFLWQHLWACTGLGATLAVLFAIPVISSFCLPVAVVSGTLLYARARSASRTAYARLK